MKKIKLLAFKATKLFLITALIVNMLPLFIFAEDKSNQVIYSGNSVDENNVIDYTTYEDGAVKVSKRIVSQGPENYFDIELEVQTKSEVEYLSVDPDVSIALVLDTSSSMTTCMTSSGYRCKDSEKRLGRAKTAIDDFTDNFFNPTDEEGNPIEYGGERKLALVTFDNSASVKVDFDDAASTNETLFDNIVNGLVNGHGTNLAYGLEVARGLFDDDDSFKYIILLTDGYPTTSGINTVYADDDYGNVHAIAASAEADKNRDAGIKTYVIGVGIDDQPSYTTAFPFETGYTQLSVSGGNSVVFSTLHHTTSYIDKDDSKYNVERDVLICYGSGNNANSRYCLSANDNGTIKNSDLRNTAPSSNDYWRIYYKDGVADTYVIKNVGLNKYLSATKSNGNYTISFVDNINNAATFMADDYNALYLKNDTNYYLKYAGSGSNYSWRISKNSGNISFATYGKKQYSTTKDNFKDWLRDDIAEVSAGEQAYYDVKSSSDIEKIYTNILKKIQVEVQKLSSAWIATDPMNGKNVTLPDTIEFVGFYDKKGNLVDDELIREDTEDKKSNSKNHAYFEDDSIIWKLRESTYESSISDPEGGEDDRIFTYKLKYRVRLKNENEDFVDSEEYFTNGEATLEYAIVINDEEVKRGTAEFENPQVTGYLVDLVFDKTSVFTDSALAGATFELKHDVDNCICKDEHKHLDKDYSLTSVSNSNDKGNVVFNNVPSGHTYILSEIEAPENYEENTDKYIVKVNYDDIVITDMDGNEIESLTIINYPKGTDLEITKTVKSDNTKGTFEFVLEASYDNKPLKGTYSYTIGDTTGDIVFKNGKATINNENIKLSHGETIVIDKLPYGIEYTVSEINNHGFVPEYCVNFDGSCLNSNDIQIGSSTSTETISEDSINRVEFVNVKQYELPETGSMGMLIVQIIGGMFLLLPIVKINNTLIKKRGGANSEY